MKRYLTLADGTVLQGEAIGAEAAALGELVFTTGMGGYMETLTDPSYYGQIVLQTFPMIGNYGAIPEDAEGECRLSGYVVRELCGGPSNFRCVGTLDDYLRQNGVPGIAGVDTRLLTARIREHGVMNAMLSDAPDGERRTLEAYTVSGAVEAVTCRVPQTIEPEETRFRVTLLDYGAKRNIVRELLKRGCRVTVVPASTPASEILAQKPDGVMLSNGPGDPEENRACIDQLRHLMGHVPMFGICLGHQLMALAQGGKTKKLLYGHRGVNQPVRDLQTGRTGITTQNHGYAVEAQTVKAGQERYQNANDGTCEGMDYPELNAFSVQFHPEACAGPRDMSYLFDRFAAMMGG